MFEKVDNQPILLSSSIKMLDGRSDDTFNYHLNRLCCDMKRLNKKPKNLQELYSLLGTSSIRLLYGISNNSLKMMRDFL